MARLVTSGRTALAISLRASKLHFAWGRGEPWWNTTAELSATFAGAPQQIALPHAPIASIVVTSIDGAVAYLAPDDYTWDAATGLITRMIGGAIAPGATVRLAVSYGRPLPPPEATALIDEIGRRAASSVAYVIADDAGELATADGLRWSIAPTPTRHLYTHVRFDFHEAADQTIRELAVIVGTVPHATVPIAQPYLLPADIADPGVAFLLDHLEPIARSPAARPGFSYVITL